MTRRAPPPWSYTRNQRLGLLIVLMMVIGAYLVRGSLIGEPEVTVYGDATLQAAIAQMKHPSRSPEAGSTYPSAEFTFDPNTVSVGDLSRLGLSEKQANSFVKYRDRKPFSEAGEIGNLYVLNPEQSAKLIRLARIPKPATAPVKENGPSKAERQTFGFDPNFITPDSFRLLGFSDWESKIFAKYRGDRDNTFRKPEDLLRITALDSQRVRELLPLMTIAASPAIFAPASAPTPTVPAYGPASFDVNGADLELWQQLPGIGPARAKRIVEFRERLGGFISPEQVGETYGLPDSTFQEIKPMLTASPIVPTLYINRLDASQLSRHPYLDRRTAEIIVRYRENHGPFSLADDLTNVRALSTESLAVLLPYLNFAQ